MSDYCHVTVVNKTSFSKKRRFVGKSGIQMKWLEFIKTLYFIVVHIFCHINILDENFMIAGRSDWRRRKCYIKEIFHLEKGMNNYSRWLFLFLTKNSWNFSSLQQGEQIEEEGSVTSRRSSIVKKVILNFGLLRVLIIFLILSWNFFLSSLIRLMKKEVSHLEGLQY